MKKEKKLSPLELMYAIGMVDERYLAECENVPATATRKVKLKRRYISYLSAAACFILIISGVFLSKNLFDVKNADNAQDEMSSGSIADTDSVNSKENVAETETDDNGTGDIVIELPASEDIADINTENDDGNLNLPDSVNGSVPPENAETATIPDKTLDITGAGDSLSADDILFMNDEDLAANSYGTISDESRLALFSNCAGIRLTDAEVKEKANVLSSLLGEVTESEILCGTTPADGGASTTAAVNKIDSGYTLSVYSTGDWKLRFAQCETYDISDDEKLRDAAISAAQSLSSLLGYSVPEAFITHSRSSDGTLISEVRVYDAGDGSEISFAEREFSYMTPDFDSDGKLHGIYVCDRYSSGVSYYGTYCVIGYEEAVRELDAGYYISAYPAEDKLSSRIAFCESAYIYSGSARCLIPYYKFTVRLNGDAENGLYRYGSYYVPAINPDEISGGI